MFPRWLDDGKDLNTTQPSENEKDINNIEVIEMTVKDDPIDEKNS